jgi:hypothetical protein
MNTTFHLPKLAARLRKHLEKLAWGKSNVINSQVQFAAASRLFTMDYARRVRGVIVSLCELTCLWRVA